MSDDIGFTVEMKNLLSDGFEKIAGQLDHIAGSLDSVKESSDKTAEGMGHLFETITEGVVSGELIVKAFEMVGEGLKELILAFPELEERVISVGNQIYEMSLKTGASVEGLSALRYVASQIGVDFNSFGTVFFKMEANLGATGQKADKLSEQLDRIGLSMTDLKNMRPDEAFIQIAEALEKTGNNADKAYLAQQIFGRGAREMAALWHEDIGEMITDAERLGLIMDTKTAAAAHAVEIGYQALSMQFEAVGIKIGEVLLPGLLALEHLASDSFNALVQGLKQGDDAVSQTQIDKAVVRIGEGIIVATAAMAGFAQGATTGLKNVLDWSIRTGEALVNVGAIIIKIGTLGTVDEAGKTFLDKTMHGLHDTYDALELLKGGVDSGADALNGIFGTVEKVADGMSGKMGNALTTARSQIEKFAEASKHAGGGVSTLDDAQSDLNQKIEDHIKLMAQDEAATVKAMDTIAKSFGGQTVLFNMMMAQGAEGGAPPIAAKLFGAGGLTSSDQFGKVVSGVISAMPDLSEQAQQHIQDVLGKPFTRTFDDILAGSMVAFRQMGFEADGAWAHVIQGAEQAVKTIIGFNKAVQTGQIEGSGIQTAGAYTQAGLQVASSMVDPKTRAGGALSGASQGAAIGTMIMPGYGTLIGAGVGALVGALKVPEIELEGRAVEKQFESMYGSFDKMQGAIVKVYEQTGRSAQQALYDVHQMMLAESEGGDAVQKAIDKINSAFNEQAQDTQDLNDAIQEYGFTVEQLGPQMQKQQLTEQAQKLENQWRLLVGSGIDMTLVTDKMSGKLNDYIQLALKTGQQVPLEMKPIIEQMIKQGDLTDANGNKITDMATSGITFTETFSQGVDRIVKALNDMVKKLGFDVPEAIKKIPKTVDVTVNSQYNDETSGRERTPRSFANEGFASYPQYAMVGDVPGGEFIMKPSTLARIVQGNQQQPVDMKPLIDVVSQMRRDIATISGEVARGVRDGLLLAGT